MNNNAKGAIVVLVILAIAGTVFYFTHQNKSTYAKHIIKLNGTGASYAELITRDEGYLRSWAKALTKGKQDFVFNNERYNTSGGKKIVS